MSLFQMFHRVRPYVLLALAAMVLLYLVDEQYQAAHADALTALERFRSNRRQAAEIKRMRRQPAFAATEMAGVSDLTARILAARTSAEIAEPMIDLVDPRPPERMGDSPYLLRPVVINLRGLKLAQAAQFAASLTDLAAGLWVNQFHLRPVRRDDQDEAEFWNVDLILTQVVFFPTSR